MTPARQGFLGLALALFAASGVSAQDFLPAGETVHERILEISPVVGVFLPDDNIHYTSPGFGGGLRIGLNNSQRWGVEAYATITGGLEQEQRVGMLRSYSAQPVFATSGALIGWNVTLLQTEEEIRRNKATIFMGGADFVVNFSEGNLRPFFLLGGGFIDDLSNRKEDPPGPFSDLYFDLGVGLKYYRPSGFGFRLEVRDVILEKGNLPRVNNRAPLTAAEFDLNTGGGLDGVLGQEPYLPDESRGLRWLHNFSVQASVTFPFGWAWKDGDGDLVATRFDQCPTTAPGVVVDAVGCGIDSDQDGVFDGLDQCADTPIGATVDLTGCPSDTDQDGVLDGLDQCPDTPIGAFVDENGCPSDSDQDGVLDGLDDCPDTPLGVAVGPRGCADNELERRLLAGETLMVNNVRFELGSSEIQPLSYHYINKAARLVERWTGNEERPIRIEIGVYTDGLGTEEYNKALTQRQADSIRLYLLENFFGIGANNLVATGYGEEFPIASDDTAEGREKNRRIEVRMIGEGDPPEPYDFGAGSGTGGTVDTPGPPDEPGIAPADDEAGAPDEPALPEEPELPDSTLPEPDFPDISPE
jgi:OOP family OmpA-OmpF porin